MLIFPNAKINIGLNIVRKREDGFHDLETVFYPIQLSDCLEFVGSEDQETTFTNTGLTVDSSADDNLCIKAYRLLEKDFNLPALKIHLHKIIPFGAGLGGGSSDAAFMLSSINEYFELGLTELQLIDYSLKLGSDCPFFIKNKAVFAEGRGELFSTVDLDLSKYKIVLVKPDNFVSTKEAFSGIVARKPEVSLTGLIKQPIEEWKNTIVNDFENHIFKIHPRIGQIKEKLYEQGAIYASMSGSGSSVYGIFDVVPPDLSAFKNDFIWSGHFS